MEIGHDKNQESMLRTSSKKKKRRKKEKEKEKKRILNYTMSVGICGQTSCGKKCY